MYMAISFLRRLLFAFIIVFFSENLWLQLLLCMYMNQAYLMFLAYTRIFASQKIFAIEILNEIVILLTVYHIYCFTDFVSDPYVRSNYIGWSIIIATILNFIINLLPFGKEILQLQIKRLKNRCHRFITKRRNQLKRSARKRK